MKRYRVSDVSIADQPDVNKAALQDKLNRLIAQGWTVENILPSGGAWLIVSTRESESES